MSQRKLKIVKITELDGITPKVAKPEQDMSYKGFAGRVFAEHMPIGVGYRAILMPIDGDKDWRLRTSTVEKILAKDNEIIMYTMNTVYYFEVVYNIYSEQDCIDDTMRHINLVRKYIHTMMNQLSQRSIHHDESKLESPELEIFTEFTPKLKTSTYGSEEYKGFLTEMKVGLDHHYANNTHHPEYWENGVSGMDLIDVIEMFADWKAASMRHDDGDINKSIAINKTRFNMSDELTQIFKNTVKYVE